MMCLRMFFPETLQEKKPYLFSFRDSNCYSLNYHGANCYGENCCDANCYGEIVCGVNDDANDDGESGVRSFLCFRFRRKSCLVTCCYLSFFFSM